MKCDEMTARLTFLRCRCIADISSVWRFTETSNARYKFFLMFRGLTVFLKKCFISCQRFSMMFMSGLCEVHGQFVNNTWLSRATENNFNSAQKHATRPPGLSLAWSSDRTTSLSLLSARLLTAWNFSQSFAVIQDVWDANNDSKSFIVVIWCRQGNKRRRAEGDNMNNKSWAQTRTLLLKIWTRRSSNADANRTRPMVCLFLSGTVCTWLDLFWHGLTETPLDPTYCNLLL